MLKAGWMQMNLPVFISSLDSFCDWKCAQLILQLGQWQNHLFIIFFQKSFLGKIEFIVISTFSMLMFVKHPCIIYNFVGLFFNWSLQSMCVCERGRMFLWLSLNLHFFPLLIFSFLIFPINVTGTLCMKIRQRILPGPISLFILSHDCFSVFEALFWSQT